MKPGGFLIKIHTYIMEISQAHYILGVLQDWEDMELEDGRDMQNNALPEDTQALLEELGIGKKQRRRGRKKLFIALGTTLALLFGAGFGLWHFLLSGDGEEAAAVYREYSVERGDLIVGQTESSSVSLLRETVEFPVTATVEEIYVKAGSSLKAGDPLMRMNAAEIEEGLQSYELLLEVAQLKLEQAILQQETKLLAAEQKLESSEQDGELADATEGLTVGELTNSYERAKITLEQARKDYDEYCLLNADFANDNAILEQLELQEEYALDIYESISGDGSDYMTLETLIREAESEQAALQVDSGGTLIVTDQSHYDALEAKIVQYRAAQNRILSYYQLEGYGSTTILEERALVAQEQWKAASERYDSYYEAFKEKYGTVTEASELLNKLISAEEALYKADFALEKARLNSISGELSAEHTAETAKITAETAAANYELTEMELAQAVDAAQESYNEFQKQVEDAKALIGSDGVIYAPTTGMVAALNVEVGDEVTVEVDKETNKIRAYAAVATMTRMEDVYVPITISEEDILDVSIGQDALVSMNAFPGRVFEAVVDSITVSASRAGAATVTYAVSVVFKDKNELDILEGMSADVTLLQKAVMDVLYVNNNAISYHDGVSTVQLRGADGNPVERVVETGFTDGENVEIRAGLAEGDVVLVQSAVGQAAAAAQQAGGIRGGMQNAPAGR